MKIKAITLAACAAAFVSTAAMAQYEGTTVDERIASTAGEDSINVGRGHISSFQMGLQNGNLEDAYTSWKWLMQYAPYANTGIYKQTPFMLYTMITKVQDAEKKQLYFNDMMDMFDKRLERLDALNSMEKRDNLKSTQGDVLAVRAEYYNWTAPTVPNSGYTLNKSYENFKNAIKAINENGGREVTGSFLQTYIAVSDALYKSAPNALREQYLQDYLDSKDACEKMLELAKEAAASGDSAKAQKLLATYEAPLANIEQIFGASGAADPTQIVAIYTKKFNTYKDDINKLNSSINLMAQNDCDTAAIYYQYAKAAYDIQPTFNAAIGLAQKAMANKKASAALGYYDKALELASTDTQRGKICLQISRAMASSGSTGKATEYAEKAIQYNSDLAGHAYFQLANALTRAHAYKEAQAYCDKAAAVDITVAHRANSLKDALSKQIAAQAANNAAQAEYAAWKKKRDAEEAFWKGAK